MSVTLKEASREDMHSLWEMQVEAFKGLLENRTSLIYMLIT